MAHRHKRVIVIIAVAAIFAGSHQAAAQTKDQQSCVNDSGDVAIAACDRAINYNKRDWFAYNLRGVLLSDKGDSDKAISDFNEAIRLNPKYISAYNNRAIEWNRIGNFNKAISDTTRSLEIDPKHVNSFINRGNSWWGLGDYDKAIIDYNKALLLNPESKKAYYGRGTVYGLKGELNKSISDFTKEITLDPKGAKSYNNRGNIWHLKGDSINAFADYSEAIRIDPNDDAAFKNRGNIYSERDDEDKAIADYNEAIRLNPKFANTYHDRGRSWYRKGDYDKAVADYSEAIRLNPKYALFFYSRGGAWSKKGDTDKEINDLNEAIRLDPKFANAKENLELALIKQKKQTQQAAAKPQQQPSSPSSSNGKRVALVIGNSKYKLIDALENPSKDAELVAKKLKASGFDDVVVKLNLTRVQMMSALKDFEKLAESADWAAIYFAGHGIEISGVNYLLPVDAALTEETRVSTQAINLEYLLNSVEVAKKLRLVILDACRNNPYAEKLAVAAASRGVGGGSAAASSVGRGLSRVEPQPGTLVVYSAKAGSFALDGDGENSPFAEALAKRIEQKPPIEARRLFDFVRQDVFAGTKKEQTPFSYGSLEPSEDFFFVR